MARADRRRAQRTRPAAAARRSDVVIEDTMFFPRLRRHAKWMFLFLALVVRARLRRLRRRRRRDRHRRRLPRRRRRGGVAVDLRLRAEGARQPEGRAGVQGPVDRAPGRRQHSTRRSRRCRATSRSSRRTRTALRELAALYLQQASTAQERAQIYQVRSDYLAPGTVRDTIFQLGGSPLTPDPITNAVSTAYEREISAAASRDPVRIGAGRRGVSEDHGDPADRSDRPARARPGRTVGQRHRDGDRGVRGVPEARAGRPDRTRGSPHPQAVQAVRPERLAARG